MEEEFSAIFDLLDPTCQGSIDCDQIQEFHVAFYFAPMHLDQLVVAINQVCGKDAKGRCNRKNFLPLLFELERRKTAEENAWWDFKALDTQNQDRISIKETLLLFKATHQDRFTTATWQMFMESRKFSNDDVCFDEVRMWLCNAPLPGDGCDDQEIVEMWEKLEKEKRKSDYQNHKDFIALQEDEFVQAIEARERQQYRDKFQRGAKRKLNRWVNLGVEALVFDDGLDFDDVERMSRNRVTVQDLLEALDEKYDILREKLLWEAVQTQIGEPIWSSLSESEQEEQVLRVQMKEQQLRKQNEFSQIAQLTISYQQYDSQLLAMIGYIRFQHQNQLEELQNRTSMLQADGKTNDEIFEIFAKEHAQKIEGASNVGQLLIDLHRRQEAEREFLLAVLKGADVKALTSIEMITEYALIASQQITITTEKLQFEYCAMATGLAERSQEYKSESFDSDRDLQELIALERLHQRRGKKPSKDDEKERIPPRKSTGVVDWQVEVVRQVLKKHLYERQVLIYLLQGKESGNWRANARSKRQEKREDRLKELRSQCTNWRQSSGEYRSNKRNIFIKMLLEAVALYHENRRQEITGGHNLDDTQVSACVLADVQQRQAQELEAVLLEMQYQIAGDLSDVWRREHKARQEEWLDNITKVCLAMYQLSKGESEIVQALEEKYECLRSKLLVEGLISECGKKQWADLSEEERQRRIMQKKLEERRCRQEGRLDQLGRILGQAGKDKEKLMSLMGKSREEYEKYLEERLLKRERKRAQGLDSDGESDTEINDDHISSGNILKDLQYRFDSELEAILALLQRQRDRELSERERQELLLRLRLERRRAEREGNFDEAALLMGLAERNRLSLEARLQADRERQMRLARQRIANRRRRKEQGENISVEPEEQALPESGDIFGWKDSVVKELERKHASERELQLTILIDEGSEDLREAAREMTHESRHRRLQDLKTSAENLNLDKKDDQEANRDSLEESGAIKSVLRRQTLEERNEGREISGDEVSASLLADLQMEQDKETEIILMSLVNMNQDQLSHLRRQQIWERQQEKGKNILIVFTAYEGVGSEEELLKALDKKYDALRDKLLLESLKKQIGDAEWALLSEQERQMKLLALKKEERRLRREGKLDELSQLLGDHVKTEQQLRQLMGDNKAQYEEKLKKRLEMRRKRMTQGLDPEEDGISEDEDSPEDKNSFSVLNNRFEEERDALMARLRNSDDQYLSEKERQGELARLKREQRKAKMEDDFMAAALVLGLAERHQAAAADRLKNDRSRQEQLAKQRIEAMRNRKKQQLDSIAEGDEEVIENGDRGAMQEAVIKTLEQKHVQERMVLLELLQHEVTGDDKLMADNMTTEQRQERLQQIWAKRLARQFKTQEEHMDLLQEATTIKVPGRQHRLEKETKDNVTPEEVTVSIMADLQQQQDKESETVMQQLPEKDLSALATLQQQNIVAKKFGMNENVAIIVTTADISTKAGDEELVEALENKFDTLRDKVLAEALMKQMGEGDWAKLSEKERQVRLMKLKLQERKLRQEGKYDEVAALLGDSIKSEQALELLLGDTKKAQEEKMREWLEKRKARLAQGMTEAEVQKLEDEEIQEEEKELEKKKGRNILEDLDHRLEAEKAALLAGLQGQEDHLATEQARQSELARLRREQRKARKEDKFDAAALAMGLVQDSQKSQDALQRDRKRQEQLARERLEQRKKALRTAKEAKKPGESKPTVMSVVPMPENENDKIAMQEVVIKELEMKHSEERNLLVELIDEEEDSDKRKQAKAMSEEKRQKRLIELKDARQQWRDGGKTMANEEEQLDILHKGTAIQLESKIDDLKKTKPDDSDEKEEVVDEDAQVALLADLQQQQDEESARLLKDLDAKSAATLKQIKQVQFIARLHGWNDNVAQSVLHAKDQGDEVTETQLVKALENKYDALRDKLLAESLLNQFGAAEWAAMSEKERQARLMKLRLQERKLRQEGKFDEATALLTQGIKNQEELARMLGDTKLQQEDKMKARLARLKELKAEREAEGLAVDDDMLEDLVDKEETRKDALETRRGRKRNILEDLSNHFDAEKDALLAGLRNQDAQLLGEKERQLALAKLRRDKRKLQAEDNLDTAAMLFGMAQENESSRQTNLRKEKERQKKLARERLLAQRRKRTKPKDEGSQESEDDDITTGDFMNKGFILRRLKQDEEENSNADAMEATKAMQGEGQIALHNAIQDEMDKKHKSESEILVRLMDIIPADKTECEKVNKMSDEELAADLGRLKEDRDTWKKETDHEFGSIDAEQLDQEQLTYHLTRISCREESQLSILKKAVILRMEDIRRNLVAQGKSSGQELDDEVCVALLAELQSKQTSEMHALTSLLTKEQQEELLIQLKITQRRHRREYWVENLVHTIFNASATAMAGDEEQELSEEDLIKLKEQEDKMREMDEQLEKEKQQLLEKEKDKNDGFDAEAMLRALEAQHEAKKRAMQGELTKQKRLAMQKLEARRQRRQDKDYEELAAVALLQNAEKNQEVTDEIKQATKEKQSNLMKDRLTARRDARKKAEEAKIAEEKRKQEEERKKIQEAEEPKERAVSFRQNEAVDTDGEISIAPSSASSRGRSALGLHREKTVIDVDISEDKKKELFNRLMQDHSRAQMRIEAEKEERQKMLQERIQERKSRNQNAATMILGLGERQKTIVERNKKEERDRQISNIKERIERVRFERTQTMKLKADQNTQAFNSLAKVGRSESQDRTMADHAAKLQEKFAKEQLEYRSGEKKAFAPDADEDMLTGAPAPEQESVRIRANKLNEADRKRRLKEKMKKKKAAATSIAAASDMDSLAQMIDERKKNASNEAEVE